MDDKRYVNRPTRRKGDHVSVPKITAIAVMTTSNNATTPQRLVLSKVLEQGTTWSIVAT